MAEITRYRRGEPYTFYVDDEDADLDLLKWNVHKTKDGRVYLRCWRNTGESTGNNRGRRVKYRVEYCHQTILERKLGRPLKDKMDCDHKDRDTTNNRRFNLREATRTQNSANTLGKFPPGLAHGVGPYFGRFRAQIAVNGKTKVIGVYDTIEEASAAFRRRHVELHGEFSPYFEESEGS